MITASDIRKGITFEFEGNIFVVVDFLHVKPGKGAAFVRVKMKDIVTGQTLERTFNPSEKLLKAVIEYKEMQYLYNEGNLYYFMDTENFEQVPLNKNQVEDSLNFLVENSNANIKFYKGVAFSVEPPNFVELNIIECDPGVQGDTTKSGSKSAKLETGYTIQVPLFVNNGERIRVDTRTGTYMERV